MLLLVLDSVRRSRYWHPAAYKDEYIGTIHISKSNCRYLRRTIHENENKTPDKNLYIFPMQWISSFGPMISLMQHKTLRNAQNSLKFNQIC